jgi:protein-tyrosine phosphatase
MPGRGGQFDADLIALLKWSPDLVLTMTTTAELTHKNATDLPMRLAESGTDWLHLPIEDFGAPHGETTNYWPEAAKRAHKILDQGGKVLAHCMGGQGRSGMAILRLMVERGIAPKTALNQIRAVRPNAVETDAQYAWATQI